MKTTAATEPIVPWGGSGPAAPTPLALVPHTHPGGEVVLARLDERTSGTGPIGRGFEAFDAVVAAAASGEHAALTALFRAYQPMLLRYLRGQGPDVAEDVASEVWIAVARHLARFEGDETGFRRWMFTIARCRLIEVRRKQARQRTTPATPEILDHIDPVEHGHRPFDRGDPATAVIDRISAQEAVDTIVARLTPDQAEVVLLRLVAGFDVAEVAAIMGRSPTSVRVLCHRALRRLRDRFPEGALVE